MPLRKLSPYSAKCLIWTLTITDGVYYSSSVFLTDAIYQAITNSGPTTVQKKSSRRLSTQDSLGGGEILRWTETHEQEISWRGSSRGYPIVSIADQRGICMVMYLE